MKEILKLLLILIALVFIVPLLWLLIKEIWWLFGGWLVGLFGSGFGWGLLLVVSIIVIIILLCN